jgi:pyruvate/2-oxoglutarate dehydrogenase complex dihydrolipoamide acyltransferase (E2) component
VTGEIQPSRQGTRVIVERDSVNDDFVVVTRLVAIDGAQVLKDQPILEVETSKSVSEVAAPTAGRVSMRARVGDELRIGELMFEIEPGGSQASATPVPQAIPDDAGVAAIIEAKPVQGASILSLAARRAAQSHAIAAERFVAGAWVTEADVLAMARTAETPTPVPEAPARTQLVKQSKRKRIEIRNLAVGNAHGSTSTIGATITLGAPRLVRPPPMFRDSIADLIVFEGARLMKRYPRLNGYCFDERQIAVYEYVNFGISFDSDANLKVLAIQDCDTHGLSNIQQEFARLLELYESGGRIDEQVLASATVTLSDLSSVPVSFMHPLINGRQALILGVTHPTAGRYEVFASFDHRVTEGLEVSRFLGELQQRIGSHFGKGPATCELLCSACRKTMQEELRLGGRGFLDVTLGDGSKGLLCRSCFAGY